MDTTSKNMTSDLLISESGGAEFTRESVSLTGPSDLTEPYTFPIGYPVMLDGTPVLAADIGDCEAVILERVYLDADEVKKVAGLARGPAVLAKGELPTVDYAGTAINAANFVAALEALNIIVRDELPTLETKDS